MFTNTKRVDYEIYQLFQRSFSIVVVIKLKRKHFLCTSMSVDCTPRIKLREVLQRKQIRPYLIPITCEKSKSITLIRNSVRYFYRRKLYTSLTKTLVSCSLCYRLCSIYKLSTLNAAEPGMMYSLCVLQLQVLSQLAVDYE